MKQFYVFLVLVVAASATSESDGLLTTALKFVKDCNEKSITLCIKVRREPLTKWRWLICIAQFVWNVTVNNRCWRDDSKKQPLWFNFHSINRYSSFTSLPLAGASPSVGRPNRRRLRHHWRHPTGANRWAYRSPLAERRTLVRRSGDTRTRSRLAFGGSRFTLPRIAHSPIQSAERLNQRRSAQFRRRWVRWWSHQPSAVNNYLLNFQPITVAHLVRTFIIAMIIFCLPFAPRARLRRFRKTPFINLSSFIFSRHSSQGKQEEQKILVASFVAVQVEGCRPLATRHRFPRSDLLQGLDHR